MKLIFITCCILLTSFTWKAHAKLFGLIPSHKGVLRHLSVQLRSEIQNLNVPSHGKLMKIRSLLDAIFGIFGTVLKLPLFPLELIGSPFLFSLCVIGRLVEVLIHFFVPGISKPGQAGFVDDSQSMSSNNDYHGLPNYDYKIDDYYDNNDYPEDNDNNDYDYTNVQDEYISIGSSQNKNEHSNEDYHEDEDDGSEEYLNSEPSEDDNEYSNKNNPDDVSDEHINTEPSEDDNEYSNDDFSEKVEDSYEYFSNVDSSNENKQLGSSNADNEDVDKGDITEMIKLIIDEMEDITTLLVRHKDEDKENDKIGRYFVPITKMLKLVVTAADDDTQSHENKIEDLGEIHDSAESLLRFIDSQTGTKTKSSEEISF